MISGSKSMTKYKIIVRVWMLMLYHVHHQPMYKQCGGFHVYCCVLSEALCNKLLSAFCFVTASSVKINWDEKKKRRKKLKKIKWKLECDCDSWYYVNATENSLQKNCGPLSRISCFISVGKKEEEEVNVGLYKGHHCKSWQKARGIHIWCLNRIQWLLWEGRSQSKKNSRGV